MVLVETLAHSNDFPLVQRWIEGAGRVTATPKFWNNSLNIVVLVINIYKLYRLTPPRFYWFSLARYAVLSFNRYSSTLGFLSLSTSYSSCLFRFSSSLLVLLFPQFFPLSFLLFQFCLELNFHFHFFFLFSISILKQLLLSILSLFLISLFNLCLSLFFIFEILITFDGSRSHQQRDHIAIEHFWVDILEKLILKKKKTDWFFKIEDIGKLASKFNLHLKFQLQN